MSFLCSKAQFLGFPSSSVKNPPAMQAVEVQFLDQEVLLEKEMATHSQYSCLGNPMDRGAWEVTVHGVTMTERLTAHTGKDFRRNKLVKTETTQRKKGES